MPIVFDDTQEMLRDSALAFLKDNAPISALRTLRDTHDPVGFSRDLWRQAAELGFTGVLIDEAYGGSGLGVVEAGIIAEAIGATLAPLPFLSTSVLGASLLGLFGSDTQRSALLPEMASGRHLTALALDEGSKHRPDRITMLARRHGDGYMLDGSKVFVVDGHVADTLIVVAKDAQAGVDGDISLFLVPRDSAGVRVERCVIADATNAARVTFEGVRIPAYALLGRAGNGAAMLDKVLDIARAVLSSELVGIADATFARTLAYLKERSQFGKQIGEFQALQHRAAHLFAEIELARAAVLQCQQRLDAGRSDGPEPLVCVAKAKAGTTTTLAVQEGVQMHGGIGMTDELDIGFYMKRARTAQEWLGDANWQLNRWAGMRGY